MPALDMPLPAHVLVGLSGGADSVALTYLLRQRGVRITAVHVDHGLRGDASDGDARFVRDLCEKWGLPLLVYRADPPDNPGEDWARRVRYGFFRQAMDASGADALVLAHHRDDQAETLLLHLLRGAGLTGLSAMSPDTVMDGMRILRPLLAFSREDLRALLFSVGQDWREDASNADPRYLRNALRGEVLPLLERLSPGAASRLATAASLLRADEEALSARTDAFLSAHLRGRCLPLSALMQEAPGMRRRILRAFWQTQCSPRAERSLSAARTDAFCALIDGSAGDRCNLPGDWHGQRGWTHLHLIPPQAPPSLPETPLCESPLCAVTPFSGDVGDGRRTQALPASLLSGLTVRTRRPGDWLIPFGGVGRKSLQDYLVDRRIDAPFRDSVPLVCRGSEVLLVGGVGAGNLPRVDGAEGIVVVAWRGEMEWGL